MFSLYNLPTMLIFIIFIITIPVLALISFYIFQKLNITVKTCSDNHNGMISIYISISTLFLAVMVSFLVITVWNNYALASLNSQKEAQTILLLYQNIYSLPDTENIQLLIQKYLDYIINVEYPQLKNNDVNLFGAQILGELQATLYNYKPQDERQNTIYNNSVGLMNAILDLRVSRIHNGSLNYVIWLVAIFDSILIVIMTWLLNCKEIIHYLLVAFISIFIAASLFLIFVLSYPFRGQIGLTSQPFQDALIATQNYQKKP